MWDSRYSSSRLIAVLVSLLVLFDSFAWAERRHHGDRRIRRQEDERRHWVDVWTAMPQLTEPQNLPPAPFNGTGAVFQNATLRQTIKVTLAASTVRLQISNAFGISDLPITAATLALPAGAVNGTGTSAINPDTLTPLTFSSGSPSVIVPNGALAVSDPVDLPSSLRAGDVLTVSLYLASGQASATNAITSHPGSRTTSFFSPGNQVDSPDVSLLEDNSTARADHWYFISGLESWLPRPTTSALAIVGDSITDGRGSTTNGNDRWPDVLASRLQTQSRNSTSGLQVAVLNQAAGGNRILADGLGPNALSRIERDVVAQPGVRYAMIFEGVNDIGAAAMDAGTQGIIGDGLIAAYEQIIARLHRFEIPVFGCTITPFSGPGQAYSSPERELTRQRVNDWIRTAGRFDAVVDFDVVVRNQTQRDQLSIEYDSGDYLHLNPAGYVAMGSAVDLALFEEFADGVGSIS